MVQRTDSEIPQGIRKMRYDERAVSKLQTARELVLLKARER